MAQQPLCSSDATTFEQGLKNISTAIDESLLANNNLNSKPDKFIVVETIYINKKLVRFNTIFFVALTLSSRLKLVNECFD